VRPVFSNILVRASLLEQVGVGRAPGFGNEIVQVTSRLLCEPLDETKIAAASCFGNSYALEIFEQPCEERVQWYTSCDSHTIPPTKYSTATTAATAALRFVLTGPPGSYPKPGFS